MPKFYRSGSTDEKVIEEILINGAYRKPKIGFDIGPNDVWLDGGAQIGIFAEYAASRGAKKVVCYEPEKSNFALLKKNCESLTGKYQTEFETINRALTNKGGYEVLHVAPNTWRHAIDTHYKKKLPTQRIKCDAFRDALKKRPEINCVKLDIEGAELEILKNPQPFENVNKLVFEYSFTKNRSMNYFFSCVVELKKNFKVFYPKSYHNQKHNGKENTWGGFVDDVVFCLR
jgi:FkbM family methyltransferase